MKNACLILLSGGLFSLNTAGAQTKAAEAKEVSRVVIIDGKKNVTQGIAPLSRPLVGPNAATPNVKTFYSTATHQIDIEASSAMSKAEVYDANGRMVATAAINNAKAAEIDARQLSTGMYIVKTYFAASNAPVVKKIIIN